MRDAETESTEEKHDQLPSVSSVSEDVGAEEEKIKIGFTAQLFWVISGFGGARSFG
jgi:hypothetical protein